MFRFKAVCLMILLALFAVSSGNPALARDSAVSRIAEKAMPSVVSVCKREDGGKLECFGSGFVIDSRGYVLTNEHVIHDWEQIAVGFNDGMYLPAEAIWKDKDTDLAVLKVLGKHAFPEVKLGPADVKLGETVIALGCPAGIEFSVANGIVSRVDTLFFEGRVFKKAIQTDAPINGGNSGGPLFNTNGEVVGVVAVRLSGNQGIAWAYNADLVMYKLASVLSAYEMAGIQHGIVVEHKVLSEDGPHRRAVLVRRASGQATKAGLKRGDRIISLVVKEGDDFVQRQITSRFDLERSFWSCQPDDKVTLNIIRDGKRMQVELTLGGPGSDPKEE